MVNSNLRNFLNFSVDENSEDDKNVSPKKAKKSPRKAKTVEKKKVIYLFIYYNYIVFNILLLFIYFILFIIL